MKKITPFLWFDDNAEEAANFYVSLFKNSEVTSASPSSCTFTLDGQDFMALNAGPTYKFNEAISMFVSCEDQNEVDELWSKLTADGGQEGNCGWLKDKYGLSWQIVPKLFNKLMSDPDSEKSGRVMQAMLKMTKMESAKLQAAYDGAE